MIAVFCSNVNDGIKEKQLHGETVCTTSSPRLMHNNN